MIRNIKIPNSYSSNLAEFLGILFGDGYMNHYPKSNKYLIEIAGHSEKDFDYHKKHILNRINELFNIDPNFRIRKDQNTLYTQIISKNIFQFLERVGMPKGKKTNLIIPSWIKENKEYFIAFIKGLYDTDGSVIIRARNQNSVSLGSKNKELIYQIKPFLEGLGYFVAYNKEKKNDKRGFSSKTHYIRINQKKLINKFAREIGSANPYKIERLNKISGNAEI